MGPQPHHILDLALGSLISSYSVPHNSCATGPPLDRNGAGAHTARYGDSIGGGRGRTLSRGVHQSHAGAYRGGGLDHEDKKR